MIYDIIYRYNIWILAYLYLRFQDRNLFESTPFKSPNGIMIAMLLVCSSVYTWILVACWETISCALPRKCWWRPSALLPVPAAVVSCKQMCQLNLKIKSMENHLKFKTLRWQSVIFHQKHRSWSLFSFDSVLVGHRWSHHPSTGQQGMFCWWNHGKWWCSQISKSMLCEMNC